MSRMPNNQTDDGHELRHFLRRRITNISTAAEDDIIAVMKAREQAAERRGRAVGQYQAADKLYGDVCQIYMFGGNESAAKAKSIAGWSANGLLNDCEAFMNNNAKDYEEYLQQLSQGEEGETK